MARKQPVKYSADSMGTYAYSDNQYDILGICPPYFTWCEGSMVKHTEDEICQAGKLQDLCALWRENSAKFTQIWIQGELRRQTLH